MLFDVTQNYINSVLKGLNAMRESYLIMGFWMWVIYVPFAVGFGVFYAESIFIVYIILACSMVGLVVCDWILIARKDWVKIAQDA